MATRHEKVIEQSTIDAAVQDSEAETLINTLSALNQSFDSLNDLEKFITEQVGISNAPSFAALRNFLKESKVFLLDWHERKGLSQEILAEEAVSEETEQKTGRAVNPAFAEKSVSGTINNSQDVVKALTLICDYYKKHEPSSPVPIFLERGMKLVGKSFMEILEDVAPTGVEQAMAFKSRQKDDS
jgi:type VI secretion system protein ImpA